MDPIFFTEMQVINTVLSQAAMSGDLDSGRSQPKRTKNHFGFMAKAIIGLGLLGVTTDAIPEPASIKHAAVASHNQVAESIIQIDAFRSPQSIEVATKLESDIVPKLPSVFNAVFSGEKVTSQSVERITYPANQDGSVTRSVTVIDSTGEHSPRFSAGILTSSFQMSLTEGLDGKLVDFDIRYFLPSDRTESGQELTLSHASVYSDDDTYAVFGTDDMGVVNHSAFGPASADRFITGGISPESGIVDNPSRAYDLLNASLDNLSDVL